MCRTAALLLSVSGMSGVSVNPSNDVDGVWKYFGNRSEILLNGTRIAWQVHNERATTYSRGCSRQHGVWSDPEAFQEHRLRDRRHLSVTYRSGRIRRDITW